MPGANCSIYGCSSSRRKKYKGVSIFKLPSAKDPVTEKWRKEIMNVITRDRKLNENFKKQISGNNVFICEKHFSSDQIYHYEHKKELKAGAVPTLNLPIKSIASTSMKERSTLAIDKREVWNAEQSSSSQSSSTYQFYKDFNDFSSRLHKLKLNNCWKINQTSSNTDVIKLSYQELQFLLPKFEIFIDSTLAYTIRIYGWLLPDDHFLYTNYCRSFLNVTLSDFIIHINKLKLCPGITLLNSNLPTSETVRHVVPKVFSFDEYDPSQEQSPPLPPHPVHHIQQVEYLRSKSCIVLDYFEYQYCKCKPCLDCEAKFKYSLKQKEKVHLTPAHKNAPVSNTDPHRIKLTLTDLRLECHQLKEQIKFMKTEIEQNGKPIDKDLNDDFISIFSGCDVSKIPPFMKLFWEEQQKYLKNLDNLSSIRYHPMIIKFCLNLAAKSSSSYSDLRYNVKDGTGVLVLPSLRTLRDYKNYIRPQRGFNDQLFADLKEKTKNFSPSERFIGIQFDEMKIQEDLVWDKYSGELIGFVDLGDINVNFATLPDQRTLASHVLVFLIRSIINPLSFSIATFATTGATSFQIFPLFWKCVAILEYMDFKVISCTADGASPNRKFFKMHKALFNYTNNGDDEIIYHTLNLYARDGNRKIFFFSDAPHLLKTARNCFANSGSHKNSRLLWNNGFHILWSHISTLYYEDLNSPLKLLPRLTNNHINLTSCSVMRVRLAAQVLSSTVGNVLKSFGPPDASETAKFCLMLDSFF